jgi:hypothetical protein
MCRPLYGSDPGGERQGTSCRLNSWNPHYSSTPKKTNGRRKVNRREGNSCRRRSKIRGRVSMRNTTPFKPFFCIQSTWLAEGDSFPATHRPPHLKASLHTAVGAPKIRSAIEVPVPTYRKRARWGLVVVAKLAGRTKVIKNSLRLCLRLWECHLQPKGYNQRREQFPNSPAFSAVDPLLGSSLPEYERAGPRPSCSGECPGHVRCSANTGAAAARPTHCEGYEEVSRQEGTACLP